MNALYDAPTDENKRNLKMIDSGLDIPSLHTYNIYNSLLQSNKLGNDRFKIKLKFIPSYTYDNAITFKF